MRELIRGNLIEAPALGLLRCLGGTNPPGIALRGVDDHGADDHSHGKGHQREDQGGAPPAFQLGINHTLPPPHLSSGGI